MFSEFVAAMVHQNSAPSSSGREFAAIGRRCHLQRRANMKAGADLITLRVEAFDLESSVIQRMEAGMFHHRRPEAREEHSQRQARSRS
jgi:hypothetical protein